MAAVKVSLRRLAAELEVSHVSLSKAFRAGTWCRGVQLDPAGKLEVTDAAAAIAEWRTYHAPRARMPPVSRRAPPEPPDRFPGLSRQDLIDRWQAEGTLALVFASDAFTGAADRVAAVDRITAAIRALAAELEDPAIERDALAALREHVWGLDLEPAEVDELLERIATPATVGRRWR